MSGRRRNNQLTTDEVSILKGSIRLDYLDFEDALELFIRDGEIRNLREHTIKYYRNELTNFRNMLE